MNPRHLGARIGFIGILHTWGQNLMDHPHIYCVVPGGGLSSEGSCWVLCRKGFFIPVRVMSSLFRGKFLDYLKSSFESGDLIFPGGISHLKNPGTFQMFRGQFYRKRWLVYCKPSFTALRVSLSIWADIPTGSLSATIVSSRCMTAMSLSSDGTIPMGIKKRP
jgi:hypothetical protein